LTLSSAIELQIRQAKLDDLEVVARFNVALAAESENLELEHARVLAGVEALLRDSAKGTYFVALSGGKVVGQLLITHEWSDWHNGDYWWLQSVYVHPDFRRSGIFRALFEFVQSEAARAPEVCCLRLYMEKDNTRARAAYIGMGMTETNYRVLERWFDRP
jgi:ribosomal protein S18 acetylase RimI-like enzyme